MSVQQNHYAIIGAKFGFDEFYEKVCEALGLASRDDFEDKDDLYHDSAFKGIHHHNGLCIISDGMGGKYVYVGHVVSKSDNYGGMWDYTNKERKPSAKAVSARIFKEFNIEADCKPHTFTHYR